MNQNDFSYQLSTSPIIFMDTLKAENPCVFTIPRNHESLFLVTDGNLLYEKEGVREVVKKGQVGYIARGSMDCSMPYGCRSVSYIAVNFNHDTSTPFPLPTLPFPTLCSQGANPLYYHLFHSAFEQYSMKLSGYQTICNGILLQIIGCLYHDISTANHYESDYVKLKPAVDHLLANYHDPSLQISDISKICFLSEKQFRRLFQKVFSKNPYVYLQEIRINHAETLLLHTNKSVSEIALHCGFSDVYGFSHSFKKQHGISPIEYKKQSIKQA